MVEIKHVSSNGLPLHITTDATLYRWTYDSAWSTYIEARDRIKELEAEGWLGRNHKKSRTHAVYKRRPDEGIRGLDSAIPRGKRMIK